MIRWLVQRFCARLCTIDLRVLWPACLEGAQSVDDAVIVFMSHIEHDWAWRQIDSETRSKLLRQLKEPKNHG